MNEEIFEKVLEFVEQNPEKIAKLLSDLIERMAEKGEFNRGSLGKVKSDAD